MIKLVITSFFSSILTSTQTKYSYMIKTTIKLLKPKLVLSTLSQKVHELSNSPKSTLNVDISIAQRYRYQFFCHMQCVQCDLKPKPSSTSICSKKKKGTGINSINLKSESTHRVKSFITLQQNHIHSFFLCFIFLTGRPASSTNPGTLKVSDPNS